MKTPAIVINKPITWKEHDLLGFDLEELRRGEYSWWADFVKKYSEVRIDLYNDSFDVMLTDHIGMTTSFRNLWPEHLKVRSSPDGDALLLITHPAFGRIYTIVRDKDLVKGTMQQLMRGSRRRESSKQADYGAYANYIF